jgi:hypothetical protein
MKRKAARIRALQRPCFVTAAGLLALACVKVTPELKAELAPATPTEHNLFRVRQEVDPHFFVNAARFRSAVATLDAGIATLDAAIVVDAADAAFRDQSSPPSATAVSEDSGATPADASPAPTTADAGGLR